MTVGAVGNLSSNGEWNYYSSFGGSVLEIINYCNNCWRLRTPYYSCSEKAFRIPIPVTINGKVSFTSSVFKNSESPKITVNYRPSTVAGELTVENSLHVYPQLARWVELIVVIPEITRKLGLATSGQLYDIIAFRANRYDKNFPPSIKELKKLHDTGEFKIELSDVFESLTYWSHHSLVKAY